MAGLCLIPGIVWMLQNAPRGPGCFTKLLWGLPCLTCGGTRATRALLDGRILDALVLQPLIIGLYLVIGLWGLVSFGAFLGGRTFDLNLGPRADRALKIGILGLPVLNWLYLWTMGI